MKKTIESYILSIRGCATDGKHLNSRCGRVTCRERTGFEADRLGKHERFVQAFFISETISTGGYQSEKAIA
ncbi:MAG: hypothetical protein GX144_05085 [Clostridiaceae bacterium]|nr:hypothetical protein [Clostridiaceae bacterium]